MSKNFNHDVSKILSRARQILDDNAYDAASDLKPMHKEWDVFARLMLSHASGACFTCQTPYDVIEYLKHAWSSYTAPLHEHANIVLYRHDEHRCITLHITQVDKPFIIESLKNVLALLGLNVTHMFHHMFHPILRVVRDHDGYIQELYEPYEQHIASHSTRITLESFIALDIPFEYIHQSLPNIALDDVMTQIERRLTQVMRHLLHTVEDWGRMRKALFTHMHSLESRANQLLDDIDLPQSSYTMSRYLNWLCQDHFLLLGCRAYQFSHNTHKHVNNTYQLDKCVLTLGLFRDESIYDHARLTLQASMVDEAFTIGRLYKTGFRAPINRPARVDMLIWVDDATHTVYQLIGTFTQHSYREPILTIPFVQDKALRIIQDFDLNAMSYDGKRLIAALESVPHDEYWIFSNDAIRAICAKLLHFDEKSSPIILHTPSRDQKSTTCIIFMGRDRYTSSYKQSMARVLESHIPGRITSTRGIVDGAPFARLIFVLENVEYQHYSEHAPDDVWNQFQADIETMTLTWYEQLERVTHSHTLKNVPSDFFDTAYQSDFQPRTALKDIQIFYDLPRDHAYNLNLFKISSEAALHVYNIEDCSLEIRILSRGEPIELARLINIMMHYGIRVHQEKTYTLQNGAFYLHVCFGDLECFKRIGYDAAHDNNAIIQNCFSPELQKTLIETLHNRHPNDAYNQLMTKTSMTWRHVHVLRVYASYLKQVNQPFSMGFIAQAFGDFPKIAEKLWMLFDIRFNPQHDENTRIQDFAMNIAHYENMLNAVESADQDTLFRKLLNLLHASVRTTFYAQNSSHVAIKIHSPSLEFLDDPRPLYEIFVSGFDMEGIHLRSSKVARGGIRFSDRPNDFRTEILQLMNAQNLKNAIIVPTGAKGGFIVRHANPTRDMILNAYRAFIRSLLMLCDNTPTHTPQICHEDIPFTSPCFATSHVGESIVCYDDCDPYFVVAADKGTATFSDEANALAESVDFWLKDAFASGGSDGYDHKKLGITARGAGVSVAHHFKSLGVDIQTTPISVIGVGDLSGDVFGNGMTLYPHMRLVAAFNHRHIFIDPQLFTSSDVSSDLTIDPPLQFYENAYEERVRLFQEGLGWEHYRTACLSPGGGIFERRFKKIQLTPEIQKKFQLPAAMSPNELIQALLKLPLDLLWMGGIGTYIQGSEEMYAGDPPNDAIRVRAQDMQIRVIGEGANLGVTPLARIELAQKGIHLNSDAIDNAGGVNCSDREVNLKILLDAQSKTQRHSILESISDAIVKSILDDNQHQNDCLDRMEDEAHAHHDLYCTWLHHMEEIFTFKRSTLFLEKDSILRQNRTALTRPELAILLSYTQIYIKNIILNNFDEFEVFQEHALKNYFPKKIHTLLKSQHTPHLLGHELTALVLTKNIMKSYSIHQMMSIWHDDSVHTFKTILNCIKGGES